MKSQNTEQRKLRVVPYNHLDYSLGKALTSTNQDKILDPNLISAAFSLYFQWQHYRSSIIYDGTSNEGLQCSIDFDHDEKEPTELHIKILSQFDENVFQERFEEFRSIIIRFQIFQACYEFEAKILAKNASQAESNAWNLICNVPSELVAFKRRQIPRVIISKEILPELGSIFWINPEKSTKSQLQLHEISLSSIIAKTETLTLNEKGVLNFNGIEVKAEVVRSENQITVFKIIFDNESSFGKFFDYYRKIAYPTLRNRYEFNFDSYLNLYLETGYFAKFSPNEVLSKKDNIKKTWEDIKTGSHLSTVDYFIVDDDGTPAGASSLTLSFFRKETPIWVYHQLCAKKKPELLSSSGDLYKWRAEYLSGRPENLTSAVWFDSKSRWLERLYIKFLNQTTGSSKLYAIRAFNQTFQSSRLKLENNLSCTSYKIGVSERLVTNEDGYFAGFNPEYLNINNVLNSIILLDEEIDEKLIQKIADIFLSKFEKSSIQLRLNIPSNTQTSFDGDSVVSDRFCIIEKSDLYDFISSIDHSIAVTKRKLMDVE